MPSRLSQSTLPRRTQQRCGCALSSPTCPSGKTRSIDHGRSMTPQDSDLRLQLAAATDSMTSEVLPTAGRRRTKRRQDRVADVQRWIEVTPSQFTHEAEGL